MHNKRAHTSNERLVYMKTNGHEIKQKKILGACSEPFLNIKCVWNVIYFSIYLLLFTRLFDLSKFTRTNLR
jgi:hypothetical protein